MKLWQRIEATPASVRQGHLLGIGLMCVVALLWASLEYFASIIPGQYFPYQIVWMRYGTHLLFMLIVLGRSEGRHLVRTKRPALHVFRSLLMLGMPIFFIAAVQQGAHPGFVWLVTWGSLPLAMAVAVVLLREPVSVRRWAATLLGLAGTGLVIRPSIPAFGWGLMLAVAVSFCLGLYLVLTRSLRTEPLSTNLFQTALWVFVALTCVMPFVWQPMSPKIVLAMTVVGLWGFLILLLLDRALACAPAALVAPFMFTECLWSAALEATRPGTHFPFSRIAGAVVILTICGAFVVREMRRGHVDQSTPPAARPALPMA